MVPRPFTICALGYFDLDGGRSWVLRTGLAAHGWRVSYCRTQERGIIRKYRDLWRQWKQLRGEVDALYLPYVGHYVLPLAWWLGRRQRIPVILDAFASLYETDVRDRKVLPPLHPKALFLFCLDWLGCRLPSLTLLDTPEHVEFFARTFHAPSNKLLAVPVGCRSDLFTPTPLPSHDHCVISFHGTFIPLQGIDVILRAAAELEKRGTPLKFQLIGRGQTYGAMRTLAADLKLTSVEFVDPMPLPQLPAVLASADICLGIFDAGAKADRVIPNKAYEALAAGRPLVTAATTAARRMFGKTEATVLTQPGDPIDLAETLLALSRDPAERHRVADAGVLLFKEKFLPEIIAAPLVQRLQELVAKNDLESSTQEEAIDATPLPLSVHILTRNSGKTLAAALDSLPRCKEILVIDGGSTDDTRAIAAAHGARIVSQGTDGEQGIADFAKIRTIGLRETTQPWILILDSDELLSKELQGKLRWIVTHETAPAAYFVPRLYVREDGRIIRRASTYPNTRIYFAHRDAIVGWVKPVHERLQLQPGTPVFHLTEPSLAPLPSVQEFKEKNERYIGIEAGNSRSKGWRYWFRHRLLHTCRSRTIATLRLLRIWLTPGAGPRLPLRHELLRYWYAWRLVWETRPGRMTNGKLRIEN